MVLTLPFGYFIDGDVVAYRGLYERVPEHGVTVEIGVFCGRSLCSVADIIRRKQIKTYAVDVFTFPKSGKRGNHVTDTIAQFVLSMREHDLTGNVSILPMDSITGSTWFSDGTFDLAFIDAGHSEAAVTADIEKWSPKLKPTGLLCGHDYWPFSGDHDGVKIAVNKCCPRIRTFPNSGIWLREQ